MDNDFRNSNRQQPEFAFHLAAMGVDMTKGQDPGSVCLTARYFRNISCVRSPRDMMYATKSMISSS
jgi:hypothetical protein